MYKLLTNQKTPNGLVEAKVVYRISDNAFIPFDLANKDYQEYLKWLEEGNTPLPAENN
jgi:hypothetical protein